MMYMLLSKKVEGSRLHQGPLRRKRKAVEATFGMSIQRGQLGSLAKSEPEPEFIYVDDRSPFGASIYRCLARQLIGNPDAFEDIRRAVQDHFLRAWLDKGSPFHEEYVHLAEEHPPAPQALKYGTTFFGGLHCPDVLLCPCTATGVEGRRTALKLVKVISTALSTRIELSIPNLAAPVDDLDQEVPRVCLLQGEQWFGRVCRISCFKDSKIKFECDHTFKSCLEDRTGRSMLALLQQEREEEGSSIKRICWWPKGEAADNAQPGVANGGFPRTNSTPVDGFSVPDPEYPKWKADLSYDQFECYNEWRHNSAPEPPPPSDPAHLKGLDVHTISVTKPEQIRPALDLMDRLLERAPISKHALVDLTRPYSSASFRRLKKYVGVDAEFSKVKLDEVQQTASYNRYLAKMRQAHADLNVDEDCTGEVGIFRKAEDDEVWKISNEHIPYPENEVMRKMKELSACKQHQQFIIRDNDTIWRKLGSKGEMERGSEEELVSVLTIAIDRHLIISFYLLHMIEEGAKDAAEDPVPQLTELFERVIFNPNLVKVWFRYPSDIKVLNATIAHMFQGTERPRYRAAPEYNNEWKGYVIPTFKIKSKHFNGIRPQNLEFSKDDKVQCIFHNSGTNDQGLACPCQFGNIDIIPLLDYICRQVGHQGKAKYPWFRKEMSFENYSGLQRRLLGTNDIYNLLNILKNTPENFVQARKGKVNKDIDGLFTEFYNSLRPGMETDDRAMGYNIGDVVGLVLMMKMLTESDDRRLLSYCLTDYATNVNLEEEWEQHATGSDPSNLRRSRPETYRKFSAREEGEELNGSAIDDFPKLYYRERADAMPKALSRFANGCYQLSPLHKKVIPPSSFSGFEHDERVLARRTAFEKVKAEAFTKIKLEADKELEQLNNPEAETLRGVLESTTQDLVEKTLENTSEVTSGSRSKTEAETILDATLVKLADTIVSVGLKEQAASLSALSYWEPVKVYLPNILVEEYQDPQSEAIERSAIKPDVLKMEALNEFIFEARGGAEGVNAPPGFLRGACSKSALHWGKPPPKAGETLVGADWAFGGKFTRFKTFQNAQRVHSHPEFVEYIKKRQNEWNNLTSYPPAKAPRRPDGEELTFLPSIFNDPNRDRGVSSEVIPTSSSQASQASQAWRPRGPIEANPYTPPAGPSKRHGGSYGFSGRRRRIPTDSLTLTESSKRRAAEMGVEEEESDRKPSSDPAHSDETMADIDLLPTPDTASSDEEDMDVDMDDEQEIPSPTISPTMRIKPKRDSPTAKFDDFLYSWNTPMTAAEADAILHGEEYVPPNPTEPTQQWVPLVDSYSYNPSQAWPTNSSRDALENNVPSKQDTMVDTDVLTWNTPIWAVKFTDASDPDSEAAYIERMEKKGQHYWRKEDQDEFYAKWNLKQQEAEKAEEEEWARGRKRREDQSEWERRERLQDYDWN